jgi:hypothetical protein
MTMALTIGRHSMDLIPAPAQLPLCSWHVPCRTLAKGGCILRARHQVSRWRNWNRGRVDGRQGSSPPVFMFGSWSGYVAALESLPGILLYLPALTVPPIWLVSPKHSAKCEGEPWSVHWMKVVDSTMKDCRQQWITFLHA